jgi:archaellum biogenesis protein FlaJ (TadC family)
VTGLPVPVVVVVVFPLVVVVVFLFTGTVVSPITVRGTVAAVVTAATLLSSLGAAMFVVTRCEKWAVDSIWVGTIKTFEVQNFQIMGKRL